MMAKGVSGAESFWILGYPHPELLILYSMGIYTSGGTEPFPLCSPWHILMKWFHIPTRGSCIVCYISPHRSLFRHSLTVGWYFFPHQQVFFVFSTKFIKQTLSSAFRVLSRNYLWSSSARGLKGFYETRA